MAEKPNTDIEALLSVYAYTPALHVIATDSRVLTDDFMTLLQLMQNRSKLEITPLFENEWHSYFKTKYNFDLYHNSYDEELIANYIMVLETQLKKGDTIDFVRAVSPVIYRLFLRLAQQQIADLMVYFVNAKDDRYDMWQLQKMLDSDHVWLQTFAKKTGDRRVTSKSLQDLLLLCDIPDDIKTMISHLRRFEKSVRNPLAHLIKPFDEAELYRTTQFSSQDFLEKIIDLALYTGIHYNKKVFYFDQANQMLISLLGKND